MKKSLTHLLLAVLLLCAQAFAFAHSAEHLAADQDGQPAHHCPLCLSAHDLGNMAGAPQTAGLPPPAAGLPTPTPLTLASAAHAPLQPRQQSPPLLHDTAL